MNGEDALAIKCHLLCLETDGGESQQARLRSVLKDFRIIKCLCIRGLPATLMDSGLECRAPTINVFVNKMVKIVMLGRK